MKQIVIEYTDDKTKEKCTEVVFESSDTNDLMFEMGKIIGELIKENYSYRKNSSIEYVVYDEFDTMTYKII